MVVFREADHTYWRNGLRYPSVTEILKEEGFMPNAEWINEWYLDRGTYVHRAIQLYNKGELLEKDLDERLAPYLDAWRQFKANSQIEIIESEKMVYSKVWHYAGRLDIFCKINGGDSISDLKSGVVDAATALQLAGYAKSFENYYGIKRFGLSLKGGRPSIVPFTNFDDFKIWDCLVSLYHYKMNHGIIKEK